MKRYYYILVFLFLFIPLYVNGLEYPKTNSKIVEIYDINDNSVLYEIGNKDKVSIASLTKIATTITAIENIKNLDEKVTITKNILNTVSNKASVAGLKVGDVVTYRDLLYASMVPSGADATNALAILSSGSIDNFVNKMNELTKRIGLVNTHFVNVTGLDADNHYSTVEETRKLLAYALSNDLFKQIFMTRDYTLTNGLKVKSTLYLYNPGNKLDTSIIMGSKTGHTKQAGYALSSLSNINGHQMIVTVLKATYDGNYNNIIDSLNLIRFLMTNYNYQVLVNKDELIKSLPVTLSKIEKYDIKSTKEIKKYLPSDYDKDKIRIEYDGKEELSFTNKKDKKIGTIKYYYDNELLDSEDVFLNTEIKMDLWKVLLHYWYIVLVIILIIIIIIILIIKKRKKQLKNKKRYVKINSERRLYES